MDNSSFFIYCNSGDFKIPIYTAFYIVTFLVGFISNTVALYVFLCLLPRNSPSCIFMTNLAISDLLFTLTLPMRITYFLRRGEWIFGDPLCGISIFAFYVNMYSSILFLTAVSISRYVAILRPMDVKRIFNWRRCVIISLAIWALVSSSSSPFLLAKSYHSNGTIRCLEPQNQTYLGRVLIMNYTGLVIGFALPFIVITVCCIRIICQLQGLKTQLAGARTPRGRTMALVSMVFVVFLVCFFPYHVVRTVHLHYAASFRHDCALTIMMQKFVVVSLCLAASNSCFNPILYYFAGTGFRHALRESLRRSRIVSSRKSVENSIFEASPGAESPVFGDPQEGQKIQVPLQQLSNS
ncbi:cysteinyl leukotriene receptor 1-like [Ambystoma mexicanum]|uniref:cysteinyl leukotriene receptor 1-like n=1 Tax=Ambystoma mexicanum TaxID=8296 RepID=UPI0037E77B60